MKDMMPVYSGTCIHYSTSEILNIMKSLVPFPVHCTSVLFENGKR